MDGAGGFPKTWRRKRALVGKRIATLQQQRRGYQLPFREL